MKVIALPRVKRGSAVARVASKIREDTLKLADGELLGSEEDMIKRYEVSRPTLRQAASLVVQEQLLAVRRGVGGGYFARAPEADAVSRMAALYLKFHHADLAEILAAFMPVRVELAHYAASSTDEKARQELRAFLDHEDSLAEYQSFRDFITGERRFNHLLGDLSSNKVLALFMEILLDLSAMIDRSEDMYRNRPDRVEALRRERNNLGRAILDSDEEVAAIIARRCSRLSSEWLKEDRHGKARSADVIALPEAMVPSPPTPLAVE